MILRGILTVEGRIRLCAQLSENGPEWAMAYSPGREPGVYEYNTQKPRRGDGNKSMGFSTKCREHTMMVEYREKRPEAGSLPEPFRGKGFRNLSIR